MQEALYTEIGVKLKHQADRGIQKFQSDVKVNIARLEEVYGTT
jgi:hypothetical protein